MSITADIPRMLPDNSSDMTEEQIHKFALAVFRRCVRYEGDPVDVSKLPKDYDEDELKKLKENLKREEGNVHPWLATIPRWWKSSDSSS